MQAIAEDSSGASLCVKCPSDSARERREPNIRPASRGLAHLMEDSMSTTDISDALQKTSDVLVADPEKARARGIPATARLVEGLRFEVTGPTGEKALTDMPAALRAGRCCKRAGSRLVAAWSGRLLHRHRHCDACGTAWDRPGDARGHRRE